MIIFGQAPEQELPGMDFDVVNQQKVNFTGKVKISETRKGQLPLCIYMMLVSRMSKCQLQLYVLCLWAGWQACERSLQWGPAWETAKFCAIIKRFQFIVNSIICQYISNKAMSTHLRRLHQPQRSQKTTIKVATDSNTLIHYWFSVSILLLKVFPDVHLLPGGEGKVCCEF